MNNYYMPYLRALSEFKRKLHLLGFYPFVADNDYNYYLHDFDPFYIDKEYDEYFDEILNKPKRRKHYHKGYRGRKKNKTSRKSAKKYTTIDRKYRTKYNKKLRVIDDFETPETKMQNVISSKNKWSTIMPDLTRTRNDKPQNKTTETTATTWITIMPDINTPRSDRQNLWTTINHVTEKLHIKIQKSDDYEVRRPEIYIPPTENNKNELFTKLPHDNINIVETTKPTTISIDDQFRLLNPTKNESAQNVTNHFYLLVHNYYIADSLDKKSSTDNNMSQILNKSMLNFPEVVVVATTEINEKQQIAMKNEGLFFWDLPNDGYVGESTTNDYYKLNTSDFIIEFEETSTVSLTGNSITNEIINDDTINNTLKNNSEATTENITINQNYFNSNDIEILERTIGAGYGFQKEFTKIQQATTENILPFRSYTQIDDLFDNLYNMSTPEMATESTNLQGITDNTVTDCQRITDNTVTDWFSESNVTTSEYLFTFPINEINSDTSYFGIVETNTEPHLAKKGFEENDMEEIVTIEQHLENEKSVTTTLPPANLYVNLKDNFFTTFAYPDENEFSDVIPADDHNANEISTLTTENLFINLLYPDEDDLITIDSDNYEIVDFHFDQPTDKSITDNSEWNIFIPDNNTTTTEFSLSMNFISMPLLNNWIGENQQKTESSVEYRIFDSKNQIDDRKISQNKIQQHRRSDIIIEDDDEPFYYEDLSLADGKW